MKYLKSLVESYFTFHYGLGCAIGLIIFFVYVIALMQRKRCQGQRVSKKDILCGLALSTYLVILLGGTLLGRNARSQYIIEPILFWSYYNSIIERDLELALQIMGNILIFIPFGVLLPVTWEGLCNIRCISIIGFCTSLLLELGQLIFKLGWFEFDDIFHNTLGAVLGYGLWRMLSKRKTKL